jgi:hypothetical protein
VQPLLLLLFLGKETFCGSPKFSSGGAGYGQKLLKYGRLIHVIHFVETAFFFSR